MSQRILLLFAHAQYETSRSTRAQIEAAANIPELTLHDLYELYPDFRIDIRAEQQRLLEHDLYVLHHPFHWFGAPAIVKEWMDVVLEHGWAYGRGGTALHGKRLMQAISTGADPEDYRPEGRNRHTVGEFLSPFEEAFRLCGVEYLEPFVVYGSRRLSEKQLNETCLRYFRRLTELAQLPSASAS